MAKTPEQYEHELSVLKVHAFYIISILTTAIVIFVSIEWGDLDNLVNYINFAATISSILLAVVAIIYSYYSNSSLSQSLGSLDSSTIKIFKSTEDLTRATTSLEAKVNDIPSYMSGVEQRADQTLEKINQMQVAMSLNVPKDVSDDRSGNLNSTKESTFSDDQVDRFLNAASFLGLMLIYNIKLAQDQKKSLNFPKVSFEPAAPDYMQGFLVALYSIGLVDYDYDAGNYQIKFLHPKLAEEVKKRIYVMAAESNYTQSWLKEISTLEAIYKKSN